MCSTLYFCSRPSQISSASARGDFDPLERLVEVDDLLHLGFDRRKILLA